MGNWEANIRKVVPYVPGEQPKEQDIIKLNTNENPYPPAPEVLNKQVELENLRLYPDPQRQSWLMQSQSITVWIKIRYLSVSEATMYLQCHL